jgi:hypothetical protein
MKDLSLAYTLLSSKLLKNVDLNIYRLVTLPYQYNADSVRVRQPFPNTEIT